MTIPDDIALPEPDGYAAIAPEGTHSIVVLPQDFAKHNGYAIFTADQMRSYARAAVLEDRKRLVAQIAALEMDAMRYRWLRHNAGEVSTSAFDCMNFHGGIGDENDAAELDAAIDAALAAQDGKPE
jgi:hypothetical protein